MTLLIDPPNSPGHGRMWSHLASDESYDELHRFAATLGIPRRGFDRDHYDVPADHYERVIAAGATPVSSRELIDRLIRAGLRRRKAEVLAPKKPGRPLVRAPRLSPGDAVAVVAPSGPVPPGLLDAALPILGSWKLDVREMPHTRGTNEVLPYLAGSDADRAEDLMRAWTDPDVAAVFCARGGYGAQRMVDLLDWRRLAEAGPKVLVGFSDITTLQQAFAARLGLSTIHGPVLTSLAAGDEQAREHLRTMLFEPEHALDLTPSPVASIVGGQAEGVLVGGNVTLLASSLGTFGSLSAAESIAVLEDIQEDLYRVDRALTQLLRSGWFDQVRGVAVGQFTDCGSPEQITALVEDRLAPLGVPVLNGVQTGHVERNLAFPVGVTALLDADAGMLVLREPALL